MVFLNNLKNYLHPTMSQERQSNITSIEHKICEKLNLDYIVNDFVEIKAQKVNFIIFFS